VRRAVAHLKKHDRILRGLIETIGYPTLTKAEPTQYFYSLCKSIISQQLSLKAARTIFNRFSTLLDHNFVPENVLAIRNQSYHDVGLSRRKTEYIKNLADYFAKCDDKVKFDELSDQEIIDELTKLRGVGHWTAQMFLIFSLNRLDIFPVDDVGLQRAIILNYHLKNVKDVKIFFDIAEHWKPFRSIGSWYQWKSLEVSNGGQSNS